MKQAESRKSFLPHPIKSRTTVVMKENRNLTNSLENSANIAPTIVETDVTEKTFNKKTNSAVVNKENNVNQSKQNISCKQYVCSASSKTQVSQSKSAPAKEMNNLK